MSAPVRNLHSFAARKPELHATLCDALAYNFDREARLDRKQSLLDDMDWDMQGTLEEACKIDPFKLPRDMSLVLTNAFGPHVFVLDHDTIYCDYRDKFEPVFKDDKIVKNRVIGCVAITNVTVESRPVTYVPKARIDEIASNMPQLAGSKRKADEEEEQVCVKVKTGKGGWEVYTVSASAAKDMQGEGFA